MNRREAIQRVSILLGGTIVGADLFLSGCTSAGKKEDLLTEANITFLNEVGETILPETETPGAKEANVGLFMAEMIRDCYSSDDRKIFIKGIDLLDNASAKKFDRGFLQLDAKEKNQLLIALDREQMDYSRNKKSEDPNHYFKLMKELTLLGYFTSEVGCTKALRYDPIPGRFVGSIPYKKGDQAWALS